MVFPFSFTSMILYNPFSVAEEAPAPSVPARNSHWLTLLPQEDASIRATQHGNRPQPPPRRVLTEAGSRFSEPLQRKRGWEPATGSPSKAVTFDGRALGSFQLPSMSVEAQPFNMVDSWEGRKSESQASGIGPPPSKRRRIGETIISTAISAAIIGTAVGITAYKLWRDRGKLPELTCKEGYPVNDRVPPPPYEPREEYLAVPPSDQKPPDEVNVEPSESGRSQSSNPQRPFSRTSGTRNASPRKRAAPKASRNPTTAAVPLRPGLAKRRAQLPQPAPRLEAKNVDDDDEGNEFDEQMDWIGDRLRGLIHQGQQALNREIVVQDDSIPSYHEDDYQGIEDDGSHHWQDEDADEVVDDDDVSFRGGSIRKRKTPLRRSPSLISLNKSRRRAYTVQDHLSQPSFAPASPLAIARLPARASPARRGTVAGVVQINQSHGGSIPMPITSPVSRDVRFWNSPSIVRRGESDDGAFSGSPEMKSYMEQARRAKMEEKFGPYFASSSALSASGR